MKKLATLLFTAVIAGAVSLPLMGQQRTPPTTQFAQSRLSPHDTVSAVVGSGLRVTIYYGRPNVSLRGDAPRKIWGSLVPWGQVWRLGSDESTTLVTQATLQFGDTTLAPGAYSLYMLPVENGNSQLIINKAIGQWGIPYTDDLKKSEIAHIDLKKDATPSHVDAFTIAITPKQGGGGGTLKCSWEDTMYSVDFTAKK